jgi:hypothetical protein
VREPARGAGVAHVAPAAGVEDDSDSGHGGGERAKTRTPWV